MSLLRLKTNCLFSKRPQKNDFHNFQAGRPAHSSTEAKDKVHRMKGWAKRAPLTTCPAEKRKTREKQGAQVSLRRNTQMFAPCPRHVLERTSSTSLLGVKRASGPDQPCATDLVYKLKGDSSMSLLFPYRCFCTPLTAATVASAACKSS